MRVAIITETFLPKVDGIVKVTCLLLDHLSKSGIEALVIAPRYGERSSTSIKFCGFASAAIYALPANRAFILRGKRCRDTPRPEAARSRSYQAG